MRIPFLTLLAVLAGCSSTPYIGYKFAYQHDPMSDWVLQPDREWRETDQLLRFHVMAGLEWDKGYECGVEYVAAGYDWMAVLCSRRFGASDERGWYIQPSIVHQIDSRSSWYLRTDEVRWQGTNPFIHLRVGYRYGWFRCPVLATGNSWRSIKSGKSFGGEGEPDLYWTNVECGVRLFGKTGMQF